MVESIQQLRVTNELDTEVIDEFNQHQAEHALSVNTDFIKQSVLLSTLFEDGLIDSEEYNHQMMIISELCWETM